MSPTDGKSEEETSPTAAERQRLAGAASADVPDDEGADRREEGRHRARVFGAVGEFFKSSRKRKRK